MLDAATAAPASLPPDPDRDASARLDSAATGKILHLLSTLIAYGRSLVDTLRREDDPDVLPWYAFVTSIFGTTNPALITVVIIRGLLRAAALQARLSEGVAALLPRPSQQDRAAKRMNGGWTPRPRSPRVAGWATPPNWLPGDPSLVHPPTPEQEMVAEIVAQDCDRPIGAVLADICLDLGIVPALMDPATWDELRLAITLYGGDPARLLADPAGLVGLTGAGRESPDFRGHSATGTPDPGDSPPISTAGQPTIAFPPWPVPPERRPPFEGASGRWGRGPGP